MNERGASGGSALIEGLIITVFQDDGPFNIHNSSPLSEDEAFNMAIKTLTAIGSDIPLNHGEIRSYGPMPTPRQPYLTIGFIFALKAQSTSDTRIARFGRIVVFWIITRSTALMKYIGLIKRMMRRTLQMYHIKTDADLEKGDIPQKISEKIQIIETGIETFYITENNEMEPFLDLALIPSNSPLMLVDNPKNQIKVLLRKKPSPSKKLELLQVVNDYKRRIHKGVIYKSEIIDDSIIIQHLLAKFGLELQPEIGFHYRIHLTDQLTFEELDSFFDFHITTKRHQLITQILQSIEEEFPLNLYELSTQIGISVELIEEFLVSAIRSGLIQNSRIENGFLISQKENGT
ncbi:MAG: hypothetical protein JSV04_03010 [Candidatus Heimdallarchaeota archaeon]|nr:MAG: hypothetical protein JSV04_03010 [Candidatus Heimdallarchaeota archaeon]